ncbi:MAG TPA: condensation domain-containing protein [Longimicrobium sp.]|nr:condensation domain-containing protein [Longimicrobium sp.]
MDRRNVEDIYPLSPLQQGMLFHAVYSEGAAYQEQFPLLLTGPLDVDALERAFRAVVARHGALRTGFAWEGVPQPLQFVLRQAEPTFDRLDWSGAGDAWRARFDALMESDRRRGHDLKRPPLARITVARIDPDRHLLLLSLHHMVIDGWSLPLVVADLGALYRAERTGRPASLPSAPRYREYVQWLMSRDAGAAEAFWRQALHGFNRATPLPLDRGAQAAGSGRTKETADADPALIERAQAFARAEGVTLNTLTQAAWALLLARHAGDDDVLFGATVSGRPPEISGVERTVGLFINTVPVRVRVDEGAAVGDWLRGIQHAQADTRQYEYARLVDVQGWSEVPRDAPLFESLLVFENYPVQMGGEDGDPSELHAQDLPAPEQTNYALTLICAPGRTAFQLRLSYDPARFTPSAARRILAGVQAALASIVADAGRTVGALSALSMNEEAELARWANGPALQISPNATVHGEFARHAIAQPHALAVEDGRVRWTYAELDAVTRAIATRLASEGVGAGSRVGVAMEPSAWRVAAMLAAVRTGASYVPLDLAYPAERLAYMLEDSGIRALLADDEVPASLASFTGTLLRLPTDAGLSLLSHGDAAQRTASASDSLSYLSVTPAEGRTSTIDPYVSDLSNQAGGSSGSDALPALSHLSNGDDAAGSGAADTDLSLLSQKEAESEAYTVYTSGSTGRPKGIAVPHRAVLRMAADPGWKCGPGDRVAQVTGASFDPMAYEIWGALAAGAAVIVFDRETVLDAPAFARGLAERGVTAMFLSTGLFNQVARAVPSAFNPLRYVMVGGEAVDAQAFRAVLAAGGPRLINAYGPAEATIFTATHDVTSVGQIPEDAAMVPIGTPMVGTVVRVLDERMRLIPVGAAGELCAGGAALAHGYVGQDELTSSRFVPDPFSAEPGARLYRTGDRARWTPEGVLEYLGRLDDQVKVRGYRVEPGEIVAVLRTHPSVAAAVVAPRPDPSGAQRLVAWVVPSSSEVVEVEALRAHLAERLPEWMIPAAWVTVDHLPLTANGKVDRRALPDPDAHASSADEHVEPRTDTERELAALWREVLKAERVGASDTFFALGGHSLLAMQLAARVHAVMGVELPLRELFDHPQLAAMAARIDAARDAELAALLAEVDGMTDDEARALTAGAEGGR